MMVKTKPAATVKRKTAVCKKLLETLAKVTTKEVMNAGMFIRS